VLRGSSGVPGCGGVVADEDVVEPHLERGPDRGWGLERGRFVGFVPAHLGGLSRVGNHVRPYEALLGVRRVLGRCGCELIPTTLGIEVHEQQPVPLQPRLEADVPPGRRRPVSAREVTLTARPAERTYRIDILEPARDAVP
jgi:hypothetical protein